MVQRDANGNWRQDGPQQSAPEEVRRGNASRRSAIRSDGGPDAPDRSGRRDPAAIASGVPSANAVAPEARGADSGQAPVLRLAQGASVGRGSIKRRNDDDDDDAEQPVVIYKSAQKIFHELTPEQSKKCTFQVGIFFDESRVVCHLQDGTFTTTAALQKFVGDYGVSFIRDSVVHWLAPWAELLMNSVHLHPITDAVKKAVAETPPGVALYFDLYSLKAEVFGVMVSSFLEMKDARSKMSTKAEPRAFSVNVGLLTCEKRQILRENCLDIGVTLTIMTMAEQALPEFRKHTTETVVKESPLPTPVANEVSVKTEGDRGSSRIFGDRGRGGASGRGGGGSDRGRGGGDRAGRNRERRSLEEAKKHYGGGPCGFCGGFGHKQRDCQSDNSSMQCYRCGGLGHPSFKCASKA